MALGHMRQMIGWTKRLQRNRRGEQGQALTEYILLLAFVTLVYLVIAKKFRALNVADKLLNPVRIRYATIYRYGHPDVRGDVQSGSFTKHPRAPEGNSIRLFINPQVRQ